MCLIVLLDHRCLGSETSRFRVGVVVLAGLFDLLCDLLFLDFLSYFFLLLAFKDAVAF